MVKKLMILGAGGHGRVIAECAKLLGEYSEISFLDDVEPKKQLDHPYYGVLENVYNYIDEYYIFVAIGNSKIRERLMRDLEQKGAKFPIIIHPSAVVSADAQLGVGTVVMPGAIINPGAQLGKGVIINTASSIDHDCMIGDYCHIAVGAHLCGAVMVDSHTWIGAGSTVIQNIHICSDCILGAGAVAVKDIDMPGTYIGVPAVRK